MNYYFENKLKDAWEIFTALNKLNPQDKATAIMIERCNNALKIV